MNYMQSIENCSAIQEFCFSALTKILDANDWLSVQVHPDNAYALEHEGELERQNVGMSFQPMKVLKLSMDTKLNLRRIASNDCRGDWDHL